MSYTYDYPRPAVTVDAIIFVQSEENMEVLLIQRKNEPFKDYWALPGGFVDEGEAPLAAALRELEEETALSGVDLTPCGFYGEPGRDPRGHTISLCYQGVATVEMKSQVTALDDAVDIAWFNVGDLPRLAFDHLGVLTDILKNQ